MPLPNLARALPLRWLGGALLALPAVVAVAWVTYGGRFLTAIGVPHDVAGLFLIVTMFLGIGAFLYLFATRAIDW